MNTAVFRSAMIILILFYQSPAINAGPKKKIAVLDFDANNISASYGKIVRNQFEVSLYRTGLFQIVEREKIDLIVKERKQLNADCTDARCAAEIGSILSVDYVVLGSIDKMGEYTISVRFVEINRGDLAFAHSVNAADENAVPPAINELVRKSAIILSGGKDPEVEQKNSKRYRYLWPCIGFAVLSAASFGGGIHSEVLLRDANAEYDQLADQYSVTTDINEVLSLRKKMKNKKYEADSYELARNITLGIGAATIAASVVFLCLHLTDKTGKAADGKTTSGSVYPVIMTTPLFSGSGLKNNKYYFGAGLACKW